MSFDLDSLATNPQLEVDGVWRDLPKGAKIKVARWGNEEFQRMIRRNFKSNRAVIEGEDEIADKVTEEILIKVMAHTVLRDAQGIKFKGEEITKYTPDIGIQMLKLKDFREKVKGLAEDMSAYQDKKEEEAVKS